MVGANIDPTCVLSQVVDPIRRIFFLSKVMRLDQFWQPLGSPLATAILEVSHLFFLLGIYRNRWPSLPQKLLHSFVDVLKLCVPVGMG